MGYGPPSKTDTYLEALEDLYDGGRGVMVSDLADAVDVWPATARKHCRRLVERGDAKRCWSLWDPDSHLYRPADADAAGDTPPPAPEG
jgi:DNA-binding Lrp family transcriptional regulator